MARNARHAARAHAGARQARGGARAARAAAPARRAAAHARAAGRRGRCRRPTARARSSSRSTCTPTRRSPSTATAVPSASRSRPTAPSARSRATLLAAVRRLAGPVEINLTPQETPWTTPLDEDDEHATFDDGGRGRLLRGRDARGARAGRRARALPRPLDAGQRLVGVVRPRRRACSPGSPWSRRRTTSSCATPGMPSRSRSAGGLGMRATRSAAFFAYAFPRRRGSRTPSSQPAAAHWDATLGEFILDWDDIRDGPDPHAAALQFAQSAVRHACAVCGWDPELAASAQGVPPPVR